MSNEQPKQQPQPEQPAREAMAVILPVEIYGEILDKLACQPYREVGGLLNKLGQFQAQKVRVG